VITLAIGLIGCGAAAYMMRGSFLAAAGSKAAGDSNHRTHALRVEVVQPIRGAMDRITVQPGTVQSYESADLFAEVPGYLKSLAVDIGDHVKRGQVLAQIAVPELEQQVNRQQAMVDQAVAKVNVAVAHIATANAELDVARKTVDKFEAAAASAKAMRSLRDKQLRRYRELFRLKSIEERLVDEKEEEFNAAVEAERAARVAIVTAKSDIAAAEARLQQANADKNDADAAVKVAQAEWEKAKVLVQFATITSPYDGVITQRNFFRGDFVKAATEGGAPLPLLTVERTDLMRVVVQVPDRDVPFTDPGDPATVEVDALPGKKFQAKVSRIASSEDPQTRLMHTEIDLPNPTGKICKGMYGRVTILLDRTSDRLSVPASAIAGKTETGKANVYVVRNGKAVLVPVEIGTDNGLRVEIISGLNATDNVIVRASAELREGADVQAVVQNNSPGSST
jgi:RND family efflux transporter MFP subunit